MKKTILIATVLGTIVTVHGQNTLVIPPTIENQNINLTLDEGTNDFYSGITTNTMGANGNLLGPTIIMYRDSSYNITVNNQLADTTTIHWHGLHISPENDGGPHTYIVPNSTWNPQFTNMDKAGTYWYHPHLHEKTDEHVSKGIAGMLLVRDQEELALNLPLSYGVDEFPIIIQTKAFDANGQIEFHTENDTSIIVNGVVNPVVDFPAQIVRLRVLNGASQRVIEFGFSDNRQFNLIGTDGGLLTSSLALTRYRLAPGQRADILVDLSSDLGQNVQLMNFGSELPAGIYGASQPGVSSNASITGYDNNFLNGADFQLLDITVVAQTTNPITAMPTTLANYTPLLESSSDATRSLTFTSDGGMGDLTGPFLINDTSFDLDVINEIVPFGNTEVWTLTNETGIAHPFHIHDVQFFILDIDGNTPPPELQGLNDVVLVPGGQGTVRFIAVFDDFDSNTVPYMYHCHMLTHEDAGMMGQFIVSKSVGIDEDSDNNLSIYPNPSTNGTFIVNLNNSNATTQSIEILNLQGQSIQFESNIDNNRLEISINNLPGIYIFILKTDKGVFSEKLIVK